MPASGKFSGFIEMLTDAILNLDGPRLAHLLRPTSPHGKELLKEIRTPSENSMKQYKGCVESPWDEIAICYVCVVHNVVKSRPDEAFKEQVKLVNFFYKYFPSSSGWTLPALFAILRDLRDLAYDADLHAKLHNHESERMEDAARTISKAISLCMTDRASPYGESRKWGIYYVVGLVLKSYFRIGRISLSKNVLRALDVNTDRPPLSAYPRGHQVTYRYYLGMLGFLNEDYAKAEHELTLAFYNCHIDARNNHERILTYLIPLRILRGHMPSQELLERFPALDSLYAPFIHAIRTGDVKAFDVAFEQAERKLLNLNLWLTLEKARELCMRGLFRRVWVAANKSTRMPISMFHSSLRISGQDVTPEESECLVAVMIFKDFMRGYISHEKQMVVLSAKSAFPRLADRQAPLAGLI